MADREKVVKEKLDEMVELTRGLSYAGFMTAVENANDILALLKEQEKEIENLKQTCQSMMEGICLLKKQEEKQAIKQTYHVMMNRDYENPVEVTRYDWFCPTCKSLLCRDIDVIDDNYHFCKVCGQAVKWK